jgi:hypothetical protein
MAVPCVRAYLYFYSIFLTGLFFFFFNEINILLLNISLKLLILTSHIEKKNAPHPAL